jgi:hypothetical protein
MTNPREILDLPLPPNDAGAETIREYLQVLLSTLWVEEAQFNPSRPFGNSGWQYDIYVPLVGAGLCHGAIDADGELNDFSPSEADKLIVLAIESLMES